MSLNKTLDRLFDEIRREARRNPDFAHRIDAVLRGHSSRRDVPDEILQEAAERDAFAPPQSATTEGGAASATSRRKPKSASLPASSSAALPTLPPRAGEEDVARAINPVGLYQREGEAALVAVLDAQDREALLALVAEHNLDPGGEAAELDRDALAQHVIAQAKRRAERDSKLFDY